MKEIDNVWVEPNSTLRETLCFIDTNSRQEALIVEENLLLDVVTDDAVCDAIEHSLPTEGWCTEQGCGVSCIIETCNRREAKCILSVKAGAYIFNPPNKIEGFWIDDRRNKDFERAGTLLRGF